MKKILAATAFIGACAPVHAQQYGAMSILYCNTPEIVRGMLQERFGEVSVFQGLPQSGVHIDELFYDPDDGSYTITRTNAQENVTCIIMAGQDSVGFSLDRPRGNQL